MEPKGIHFECKNCGKEVQFPTTPNFDTNRHEQIAHLVYSEWGNRGLCNECVEKEKEKKNKKDIVESETW